jgi:enoyl-CoA hydratase/carnithine racemase
MGLVPGAGGTVSLTKKIGRHKTAYLAISNSKLSAQAALSWGLIDEVVAEPD